MADLPRFLRGAALTIAVAAAPFTAYAKTVADQSPYIVIDVDSGIVLADRQADQQWYPASLTKLMTAYVTFRAMANGKVTPTTRVVESALSVAQEPVKMGFEVGTKISLDNAIKMMLVPSANDIAVAIAEGVGGSLPSFVDTMNGEAARLGMARTHFDNPSGLPSTTQVSTARDLALLASRIWKDFPAQRALFGIQAISTGNSVYHSPNLALLQRYQGAQGMKTGFTCDAGYNLAVAATRNGRTLLAVVLGRTSSNDRAELAARLLNDGFATRPPQDGDFLTIETFADPDSDPGPIDMRICSGIGVDRVGFSESVLGSVSAVREPVKVTTDNPPPPPKPAAPVVAKGTGKGGTATASAAKGGTSGKTGTSAGSAGKPAAATLPTNDAPLEIAVPTPASRAAYRVHDDDDKSDG